MKNVILILLCSLFYLGCAAYQAETIVTGSVRSGRESDIKQIKAVSFGEINCPDSLTGKAIKNLIVQELLNTNISVLSDTDFANTKINITATIVSDAANGGGSFANNYETKSSFAGSTGTYVAGITAQIIQENSVWASITVSQKRTPKGMPSPVEELSHILAVKIRQAFQHGTINEYYYQ
jgi:hypothetical protein